MDTEMGIAFKLFELTAFILMSCVVGCATYFFTDLLCQILCQILFRIGGNKRFKKARKAGEICLTYDQLIACYYANPDKWVVTQYWDEDDDICIVRYFPTGKDVDTHCIYVRPKDIYRFLRHRDMEEQAAEQAKKTSQQIELLEALQSDLRLRCQS